MGFTFGSQLLLAVVFAAGAVAITALHLWKQRRRRVEVGFLALWLRAAGTRGQPLLRLRPLLSWLLHLATLALLVGAAGDPTPPARAAPRHLVVIVDASASMQARDEAGERTRIASARDEAARLLAALAHGDRALVVAAGAQPHARGPFSSDAAEFLWQTRVDAESGAADLTAALRLAASVLAAAGASGVGEIVLISDGAGAQEAIDRASAADPDGVGRADLRFMPVGRSGDNLAITALSARRHPAHPADYEVFVEVRSSRPQPTRAHLELRQDGSLVETVPLALPPHAVVQRRISDLAGQGAKLEARLIPDAPEGERASIDVLAIDDVARAVLPTRAPLRLLLCAPDDDLFLEAALLVDDRVKLERIGSTDGGAWGAWDARVASQFDVVVLEGCAPSELPSVPILLVDARRAAGDARLVGVTGEVAAPIVTAQAKHHPVLRFADLADVNFKRASRLRLESGDVALVSTVAGAIALARERPRRLVALGFDPRHSDLPMRPAFPILLANAVRWLAGEPADYFPSARVGEQVAVDTSADGVTVVAEGGVRDWVAARDGRALVTMRSPGFYQVEPASSGDASAPLLLAVNADPAEADIRPVAALALHGRRVPPPDATHREGREPPWRLLALAALALLIVEWWMFRRQVIA